MHTVISYVIIFFVMLTVGTVEILAKTIVFLLGLPFYFVGVLFAPLTTQLSLPRWIDKVIDWVSSRKLTWTKKAVRAYSRALL